MNSDARPPLNPEPPEPPGRDIEAPDVEADEPAERERPDDAEGPEPPD